MARIAELHDGTRLEFPDDTPDDVIQRTVKQTLGVQPERPGALSRGAKGLWQGFVRDAPDALNQVLSRGAAAVGFPGGDAAVKYWDADIQKRNADYKQNVRGGQDDFDFGRFGGNLAFTAPLSAAMPVGGGVLRAAGAGAVGGGITGGMQPVTSLGMRRLSTRTTR
jgi:hypothetical protein